MLTKHVFLPPPREQLVVEINIFDTAIPRSRNTRDVIRKLAKKNKKNGKKSSTIMKTNISIVDLLSFLLNHTLTVPESRKNLFLRLTELLQKKKQKRKYEKHLSKQPIVISVLTR